MRVLSIMTIDPVSMKPPTQEQIERMGALIDDFKKRGALIDTGGVMPGQLEMRVSKKNGKVSVVDGPFTEAKEIVGGYALFEVSGRDEALELTQQFLELVGDATCELHEVSVA